MSRTQQLRLITRDASADQPAQSDTSPVQRVFDHWVFMLDKSTTRTALGPDRRKTIELALGLYAEDVLLLAIDGCAASRWHAGENDRQQPYQDIKLILRNEANIERFADLGERLHQRCAREQRELTERCQAEVSTPESAARAEQARLHVKAMANAMRRGLR